MDNPREMAKQIGRSIEIHINQLEKMRSSQVESCAWKQKWNGAERDRHHVTTPTRLRERTAEALWLLEMGKKSEANNENEEVRIGVRPSLH